MFRIVLTPPMYAAAVVVGWTLLSLPVRVDTATALIPALVGFAVALGVLGLGNRFIRVYVFGHELTHWLTAKLFRKRTGRFEISRHGGSVEIENPNTVIVLAPYFIPVYTMALIGVYGILSLAVGRPAPWGIGLFSFGLGATYAFHVVLTWLSLRAGQQDLRICGPVFSIGVILLGNLTVMFVALTVAGRHWDIAFTELWEHARAFGDLLTTCMTWAVAQVQHLGQNPGPGL